MTFIKELLEDDEEVEFNDYNPDDVPEDDTESTGLILSDVKGYVNDEKAGDILFKWLSNSKVVKLDNIEDLTRDDFIKLVKEQNDQKEINYLTRFMEKKLRESFGYGTYTAKKIIRCESGVLKESVQKMLNDYNITVLEDVTDRYSLDGESCFLCEGNLDDFDDSDIDYDFPKEEDADYYDADEYEDVEDESAYEDEVDHENTKKVYALFGDIEHELSSQGYDYTEVAGDEWPTKYDDELTWGIVIDNSLRAGIFRDESGNETLCVGDELIAVDNTESPKDIVARSILKTREDTEPTNIKTYNVLICDGNGAASRGTDVDNYYEIDVEATDLNNAIKQVYLDDFMSDDPEYLDEIDDFLDYERTKDIGGGDPFIDTIIQDGNKVYSINDSEEPGIFEYGGNIEPELAAMYWGPEYAEKVGNGHVSKPGYEDFDDNEEDYE